MLLDHPYVHDTSIVQQPQPDGTHARVLVVKTRMWWAPEYSASNDNRLIMELSDQIYRLERLAKYGIMDFDRIDVIPADHD